MFCIHHWIERRTTYRFVHQHRRNSSQFLSSFLSLSLFSPSLSIRKQRHSDSCSSTVRNVSVERSTFPISITAEWHFIQHVYWWFQIMEIHNDQIHHHRTVLTVIETNDFVQLWLCYLMDSKNVLFKRLKWSADILRTNQSVLRHHRV